MRSRRRGSLVLFVVVLALWVFAPPVGALPGTNVNDCNASGGSVALGKVIGYDPNRAGQHGTRAQILVNAFQAHQVQTWRWVTVFSSNSNNASAGWITDSNFDVGTTNLHNPWKFWTSDGVENWRIFTTTDLTASTAHEFKVHDANADKYWSFAYDGNPMGNQFVDFSYGPTLAESWRGCTTSSLQAHFFSLNNCVYGGTCNWIPWSDARQYQNTTGGQYLFCRISATEFWVKKAC